VRETNTPTETSTEEKPEAPEMQRMRKAVAVLDRKKPKPPGYWTAHADEVMAYRKTHSYAETKRHFNVVNSVMHRIVNLHKHKQRIALVKARVRSFPNHNKAKRYTEAEKVRILAYADKRGWRAAVAEYGCTRSGIDYWRRMRSGKGPYPRQKKQSVVAEVKSNGLDLKLALSHLGRWREAYLREVQRETPSALAVLQMLDKHGMLKGGLDD
jgi:hypothetical protein